MLVFATSDKGGTGRSVTCANMAYRRALLGDDVAYVDFDFGSPTATAVFELDGAPRSSGAGLHAYLRGRTGEPQQFDVWAHSRRKELRLRPATCGRLELFPGDPGGGEFPTDPAMTDRCAELFLRLEEEFDVTFVDLSAGRSYAIELALRSTARPELRETTVRWLVFHRWTRQHIVATAGLVHGDRGILAAGAAMGHDSADLAERVRYVRAAVPKPATLTGGEPRPAQAEWLVACDRELSDLAASHRLGRTALLGSVPLDPVLQWREQLLTDADALVSRIANRETVDALADLAHALTDAARWEVL
ncbi:SCO2523 family variant P-loop protein [Yinghuangia sp. ASG 101]|uniref:SCO2523 family variant P-loop protein n=1 Tax=Yinghuangia sp. ASG 101 TaxID=2896848 RepID=UPI001E4F408A|nr:SCO2523 family variant P-loop protein [Yinghuangia sp. ASG 101]UGQ10814.1 SCO2523 family variant P-loop protein [Yinghuangia sp. ASG 101]